MQGSQLLNLWIKSGVSLINLPMSCSAHTRSYMLPAYYRNETTYEIREFIELEIISMKRLDLFTNASTFIKVPFPSIKGADLMPALSEMVDFNVDMAVLQVELQQTLVKWQDHSSRQVMTMLGKTIIVVIVVVLTTAVVIVVSAKRIHKTCTWSLRNMDVKWGCSCL